MSVVTVEIPQKEALRRGSARWGALPIDLEAVLAILTGEERGQISVKDGHLRTTSARTQYNSGRPGQSQVEAFSTEPEVVVAAIRESLATLPAVRAELDEELRARVRKYLDGGSRGHLPQSDLERLGLAAQVQAEDGGRAEVRRADCRGWAVLAIEAVDADESTPDSTAAGRRIYSDQQSLISAAVDGGLGDDMRAALDRQKDRQSAVHAQEQIERQDRLAIVMEWAREYGSADLRRAIEEGYPLGTAPEKGALCWARALCDDIEGVVLLPDDAEIGDERTVPAAASYAMRERVVDHVRGLTLPQGCEATVGRIVRLTNTVYEPCGCADFEYCSECDEEGEVQVKHKHTGVVVSLSVPWKQSPYQIALAREEGEAD